MHILRDLTPATGKLRSEIIPLPAENPKSVTVTDQTCDGANAMGAENARTGKHVRSGTESLAQVRNLVEQSGDLVDRVGHDMHAMRDAVNDLGNRLGDREPPVS